MRKLHNDESGVAFVEATILLPFCMIMVIAVYYAAIFMCQKANMQANLETALVYYKNVDSDTYVEAKAQMSYSSGSGTEAAVGSSYGTPSQLFPYRFFGMKFDQGNFESFFHSICGNMFFDTGDNIELNVKSSNYVIYKTIEATATQTVKPAVSLSLVGVPDSVELTVSGKAVVNNADDLIRNVDFVIDIVSDTKLGQMASELVGKAADLYQQFKSKFNIG